ncbi:vacuolar protein sorting-associated protein 13B-like [Amphibalanus amphitrite]|uniref:vacuolar protein sorting-associated protein 13B-like n=1 Tax=Amphibalanus amphitrite TaxID=1232801 RepID=UPI001C928D7F|nr:vacuolar protein sorting-associated protein 13B-like [Amphibalanus amphitrite]
MFKIESYITPLLLNVVEKYVKNLKAEDTQVSLWGGDAVFSNLDLKTDVLERELNLPLRFINGHIHEMRIHVPWHKLTSEPIVVTIDTMECVMRLPSDTERLDFSDTSSESSFSKQQSNRQKKQLETEEVPPGYIQTLVKKITNNLSVVCNNLILKYVEDDIVLSINVRTVSSQSADHSWTPAFTDFVPPLLFLRKLVKLADFTVCLDRRNASGKIESYQEPLLYRCSLEVRCLQQFSGLHSPVADVTRWDVLCPQLEFSVTDVQVPMLLRLMELTRALLFGELVPDSARRPSADDASDGGGGEEEGGGGGPAAGSWADWVWSAVPSPMAMLPITWDDPEEEGDAGARLAAHERVVHFSVYVQQVDSVFKMSEPCRPCPAGRRARFTPYLRLSAAGAMLSSVVRGVQAVSSSWGISHLALRPCGGCTCRHHPGTDLPLEVSYLELGRPSEAYMAGSLFVDPPARPVDTRQQYNIQWDSHMREKTESWLLERTAAMAADYLYQLELPEEFGEEDMPLLADLEYSDLPERSMFRLVVGPSQVLVTSGSVHRLNHLLTAAHSVAYPPYSRPQQADGESRPGPIPPGEAAALEANTPARGLQLTVLEPRVTVVAGHGDLEKAGEVRLHLRCQTIQWNEQQPMYPSRLCRCVSQLRRPTAALLYNCHVHTRCTVTAGQAVLVSAAADGQPAQEQQVASLSSASVYWKALLAPALWAGSQHPLTEQVCHADWLHCELSVRQGARLLRLYRSLLAPGRGTPGAEPGGPQLDLPLETDLCGLDVRLCQTGWCWAGAASLGSVRCQLDGRPVLAAPQAADAPAAGGGGERAVRALLQLPTAAAAADSCPLLVVVSEPALLCWQPALLLWLSLATQLLAGPPSPPPLPQPPEPPPPPPPAEDRASSRSGRRSPAVDVPRPHGHSRASRSARSHTTERNLPAVSPNTPAAAAVSPAPPAPPAAPPLAWLPALERLEVRLQISAVTVTVPAGPESGGGAGGDAERAADPPPTPAGHHPAPVPGRVRSSSDSGHRYCLHGQLVSVLPSVRLDSAVLKSAALPTVPDVPVRLTRPSAAAGRPAAPWQARLSGAEVYVQLESGQRRALMAPAELECTVGLSAAADGAGPLSLVVHANMPELQITLGQRQIQGLAVVVEQCFAVLDRVAPLMSAVGTDVSAEDSKLDNAARASQSEEVSAQLLRSHELRSDSSAVGAAVSAADRSSRPSVSVWLQWTLPRVSLLLVGPPGTDRLLTVMEDLAISIDSQAVYTKAKLNLASLETSRQPARNASCSASDRSPVRPDASRVVFTSSRRLTRALVMCPDRAGAGSPSPEPEPSQPQHRALLSAVCTRALRSSVLQKWGSPTAATSSGGECLTELEVRLKPCDLVLTPDMVLPYSGLLEPLLTPLLARQQSGGGGAVPTGPRPAPPATAADLPLLYVSCEPVRLFLPCDGRLCLLQLGRLRVQPAAEFPLSRPVLRPDLCPPAGWSGSGPDVDDRHYQADVTGVLVATGSWDEVLAQSDRQQPQSAQTLVTMGENPAVEWNNYDPLQSPRDVTLTSVLERCDVRVTVAPALAAPGTPEPTLLAGHALEVNVTAPLAVSLSVRQAVLLRQLADNAALALRQLLGPAPAAAAAPEVAARPAGRRPLVGGVPPSPAAADSGISSSRTERPTADAVVPFEALLTLGDVTVTLYDHEDPPPYHGPQTEGKSSPGRPVPLLYVSASQPHAFLACRPSERKLQLSVFDLSVLAGNPSDRGDPERSEDEPPVPERARFPVTLLETRPGEPHSKTGIPPSLLTATLADGAVPGAAALTVDVGRPLKLCWAETGARQLTTLAEAAQRILELPEPSGTEPTAGAGPADLWTELGGQARLWAAVVSAVSVTSRQLVLELDPAPAGGRLRAAVSGLSGALRCQYLPGETPRPAVLSLDAETTDLSVSCGLPTGPWRPLLAPWSPTLTAELEWEPWSPRPYCRLFVTSDALVLDVGAEQLACLESLMKLAPAASPPEDGTLGTPQPSTKDIKSTASLSPNGVPDGELHSLATRSEDDLRRGLMAFSQGDHAACPVGHVSFDKSSGVMSWRYGQPRSLTAVHVYPVPFVAGSEVSHASEAEPAAVICLLQYYDRLRRRFCTLCQFELSESQTSRLQLPIPVETSKAPSAALWRVQICLEDGDGPAGRLAVCPTALAACLRVDSEFRPAAVARLRAVAELGGLQTRLWLQQASRQAELPPPVAGYRLQPGWPEEHVFLTVALDGASAAASVWPDMVRLQADGALSVTAVNYAYLTEAPLLEPVLLRLDAVRSPSAAHTLSAAAADWRAALQRYRLAVDRPTEPDGGQLLLPARYVLLNNTGCRLRLGQAGTEQAEPLLPGHAALHSWRDRGLPPLLRLSLTDRDGWSRPLSLENDGEQVVLLPGSASDPDPPADDRSSTETDSAVSYPVIVTVRPLSATQKLVTLEGRLKVLNALDSAVWADVRAAPFSQLQTVLPRSCSPSVLCDSARVQVAAMTAGAAAVYREVDLAAAEPALLALGAVHAWCSVLHEPVGGAAGCRRTLVVLAPVFCARSLLPAPLELRQTAGGAVQRLDGRGAVQQLRCDPAAAHQLTMKLSAGAEWSSPPVALSVGALEEGAAERPAPPLPELAALLTADRPDWLPDGAGLRTVDQPDIQLEVTVRRRWPWLNTLLLDVRPTLLVTNECGEPVVVRCGARDAAPSLLPPAGVLAAPAADGALYISALVGGEEFQASKLVLGDQQWPYQRPPPGGQGVLPPEGAVPVAAFVRQQVALFSVGSSRRGGLRHVYIRPRVVVVNETGRSLPLAALAAGGAAEPGGRLPEVHGRQLARAARPQPLLWWQLAAGIAPDPAAAPLPLRLLLDLSGCRQRPQQLPDGRGSRVLHGPGPQPAGRCLNSLLRAAYTQRDGQTFVTVREEAAPFLLVKNDTALPVTVIQPEPAEPVEQFVAAGAPGEVPAGHSLYLPEPEPAASGAEEAHYRLQLSVGPGGGAESGAAATAAASGATSGRIPTADRATVDLTYGNTQFLHVAGHDLTAHVRVQGHTHHVQLRPVSRLEVSAQDVRARLSRSLVGEPAAERPASPRPPKASPPLPETLVAEPAGPAALVVQLTAVCDQLSVVLQDDTADVRRCQEVLRVTADRLAVLLCPPAAPGAPCRLSACVADLQVDSQLPPTAGQLYQVLVAAQQPPAPPGHQPPLSGLPPLALSAAVNSLRRSALLLLELGLEPGAAGGSQLRSLRLQARPLRLFVEDRCHAAYSAYLRGLMAAVGGSAAPERDLGRGGVPAEVRAELAALCSQVLADQLTVEPLALTLSVRTHRQLYLSIDDSPLSLPAFQRVGVRTSLERLLDELVHHYMWSAIYKAGGVVASLDLLGDPAGLARSLTLGVRDLVQLPYRGLLTGPAGLVGGCGRGLASLARHLTAGAVSSVSGLAAALAHNLHRLSLDADHLARTEEQLSAAPAGLTHGLRQGLTGLGLALLGAVASLADQPLQGAIEGRSAGALVGGLGRGLVGALTKPLGGAADLLAHTGQGLLHSAGWRRRPARRHPDCAREVCRAALAPLWYSVQLAADGPVLAVADATLVTDSRPPAYAAVTVLLLTTELRLLPETEPDAPDQAAPRAAAAYELSDTDLVPSETDPTETTLRRRPGRRRLFGTGFPLELRQQLA